MKRLGERGVLYGAIAASLIAHAAVLAARPAEPPKRPRYIVLETRLEMPGPAGSGRVITAARADAPGAQPSAGGTRRQTATAERDGVRVAISPLTLPHAFRQEQLFQYGQELALREQAFGIESRLPPDLTKYFRASELDEVAAPHADANLDVEALRFVEGGLRSLRVRVFINELGVVDDVRFDDEVEVPPALHQQLRAAFLPLRFFPAQKDGHLVKSQKLVEVLSAGQADTPS
jgi:hypothetical protein